MEHHQTAYNNTHIDERIRLQLDTQLVSMTEMLKETITEEVAERTETMV